MRDPDTGNSRGFGFISYDSFDASDAAIEVWLCLVFESYVQMFDAAIFCYTHYLIQHAWIDYEKVDGLQSSI